MSGVLEVQGHSAPDPKEEGARYDHPAGNPETLSNQSSIHGQLLVSVNSIFGTKSPGVKPKWTLHVSRFTF
jgi:hypothetical protein